MGTHFSILAWRIPMNKGTWWATVHGVAKSQTLPSYLAQHSTAQHFSTPAARTSRGFFFFFDLHFESLIGLLEEKLRKA